MHARTHVAHTNFLWNKCNAKRRISHTSTELQRTLSQHSGCPSHSLCSQLPSWSLLHLSTRKACAALLLVMLFLAIVSRCKSTWMEWQRGQTEEPSPQPFQGPVTCYRSGGSPHRGSLIHRLAMPRSTFHLRVSLGWKQGLSEITVSVKGIFLDWIMMFSKWRERQRDGDKKREGSVTKSPHASILLQ